MASRLPAESDRAVVALERVARPKQTGAPTPAVDATPRSTPTGIGKCAPVRDPRCDGESVESTDPLLSKCGKPVPLGPDSCSCALCRPPKSARPIRWCESHRYRLTSLPAHSFVRGATIETSPRRWCTGSACPSCNAPAPCPPSAQSRLPSRASSFVALLACRLWSVLSPALSIATVACARALLPTMDCGRPSAVPRDSRAMGFRPGSSHLTTRVAELRFRANRESP